jgi:hypothetical protein
MTDGMLTMHPVAFVTPTHRKDLERFELLCDSIDAFASGYACHYVIVNDDDVPAFARFDRQPRRVLPASEFLPHWLRLVPPLLTRKGRRVWWSFRSGPVHGWHVQQIIKIAVALSMPERRFCFIDSDNAFFRPFDAAAHAGGERSPLYVAPGAIAADAPLHATWTLNSDRLLGRPPSAFPADDYIGNAIVWDKLAVAGMAEAIERAAARDWVSALCRTRAFSEYLLYGHFVRGSAHLASHDVTTYSLAVAHWDASALDLPSIARMIAGAPAHAVAVCVESFSGTPVDLIRQAIRLPSVTAPCGATQT